MATFEETRLQHVQRHFTVIELDLPCVNGECTIDSELGFGTPLSCDQPSNGTKTYKFTTINAPLLPESGIFRCIKSLSETPTKLQPGRGLAVRGSSVVTFVEMTDKDPNPFSPAVAAGLSTLSGFFALLDARNILANRDMRLKNYRVESDGTIDLVNGAETRYYITDTFSRNKNGTWSLRSSDELAAINLGDALWPIPLQGFLRQNITEIQTQIQVDQNVNYLTTDVLRVGDEFMSVIGSSNVGTGTAQLSVGTRGSQITKGGTVLTNTERSDHSAGDEVYVCEQSVDERIDDLLERILIDVGISQDLIPKSDWIAEIDEWHPNTRINTLWFESNDVASTLEKILTEYLIDMWFDLTDRKIKISAISVWKESDQRLIEGKQIDFKSISKKKEESLRATRSFIIYDKKFLADPEEVPSYAKKSLFIRTEFEDSAFFGKPKVNSFKFSSMLDKDGADLLNQRYVSRFVNPSSYNWVTQEKFLTFKTGDIVDLETSVNIGFNGASTGVQRAQITSVAPIYQEFGREYRVDALIYEPEITSGGGGGSGVIEQLIRGNIADVNLYIQYAGAPSQPTDITFILDSVTGSSTDTNTPTIRIGNFPSGSKVTIILINDSYLSARGGNGGNGGSAEYVNELQRWIISPVPQNGGNGGVVIDCSGVDTDIYLSGATPSVNYPTAAGRIFAPNGGGGGFDPVTGLPAFASLNIGGRGGDSGNGNSPGDAGFGGSISPSAFGDDGLNGQVGVQDGSFLNFGKDGNNNNAFGGSKGKGVVDSGGTVTLFGATQSNYVNGDGDH